jgi:DNA-3-methyladenine glycosylase II
MKLPDELDINLQFLTQSDFERNIKILSQSDRDLAKIIQRFGNPPRWQRQPGFSTLIQIILEQQVSLLSAKATFERLCKVVNPVTPDNFLRLDDFQLKAIGFSRQKTRYGRALAIAIISHELDLDSLAKLEDITIRNKLKQLDGIGDWTVDMYLMMALQRTDVFPKKDLAVAIAIQEIKNLSYRPKLIELEEIALPWKPYRSIATQILWHYYLNRKK